MSAAIWKNITSRSKMESKEYQIGGKTYRQNYLTIDKTIRLTKLYDPKKMKLNGLNPLQILEKLKDAGKIDEFFNVILDGPQRLTGSQLPLRVAVEVIRDFLSINEVSAIIGIFFEMMTEVSGENLSQLMNTMKETGTNSSPSSPTETSPNMATSETA